MQRHCQLLTLLSMAWALSGCIVVPIPHEEYAYRDASYSPRVIIPADMQFIDPGVTTREQVLLHLGEPDNSWDQDRIFFYRWEMTNAMVFWAWAIGYGYSGAGDAGVNEVPHAHYLVVEFDRGGVMKRWGLEENNWKWAFMNPDEEVRSRWRVPAGG